MTKEKFVDRSGKIIKIEDLEYYDMVGFRYDEENDTVIWEYTKRELSPVAVVALILGCFIIVLLAIGIWCVISLYF